MTTFFSVPFSKQTQCYQHLRCLRSKHDRNRINPRELHLMESTQREAVRRVSRPPTHPQRIQATAMGAMSCDSRLDVDAFAQDWVWYGPAFRWDEDRRFLLRCEPDANFFHVVLRPKTDWRLQPAALTQAFPKPRSPCPTSWTPSPS